MRVCTRILELDYGHRVLGHTSADGTPGKCASLHGHRGKIELTCGSSSLDDIGVVIDFGKIKEVVGRWIDDNLDHRMLLHEHDPLGAELIGKEHLWGPNHAHFVPFNPTAEELAQYLWGKATSLLAKYHIKVVKVRWWETPNCYADFEPKL